MSLVKNIKELLCCVKEIRNALIGKEEKTLADTYKEYKFFSDLRGINLLTKQGLLDDYNKFMDECEAILFLDETIYFSQTKIKLPTPSKELEDFKNKFNKFF